MATDAETRRSAGAAGAGARAAMGARAAAEGEGPVLVVRGLDVRDARGRCLVHGVDLQARPGRCLGIVGESGSGKSLTTRACLGLLPRGVTCAVGRLELAGVSLRGIAARDRRRLLGTTVGYVPQNTTEYLHPMMRVGRQVTDGYLTHHRGVTRARALDRACGLLAEMGVRDPARVLASYPGELSGGLRQRVNLACALMAEPALIVADEPTAALDVVAQRQVAELLARCCRERGVAVVMVSHSLGLVRNYCDELVVMHAGRVVERGTADEVLDDPGHPYTVALRDAQPRLGAGRDVPLREIPGMMPEEGREGDGCLFARRCDRRRGDCADHVRPRARGDHRALCPLAWGGEGA